MRPRVIVFSMSLILAFSLFSCALTTETRTLDDIKAELNCVEYTHGMQWKAIQEKFGNPDVAAMPSAGRKLSQNARIYRGKTVIFHTELRRVEAEQRVRYEEVIIKLEICDAK